MFSIIILSLAIIVSSAFCSVAEAALLSLPLVKARMLVDEKKHNARDLMYLKDHIHDTIASIVILNNFINIIGSIFVGQLVVVKFGDKWLGIASAVMTLFIILLGEIIPKTLGERYKDFVALFVVKPIRLIVWLFKPMVILSTKISAPFMDKHHHPRVTEKEIKMMLALARREGTVEMDEEMLCNRVFKLNDVRAMHIMKPIDDVFAIAADKTLAELKDVVINARYSRIVVYDKDPKDIIGTVQHRVLLREIAKDNYSAKVRYFMTTPIFVNWFTKADALLEKFQAYHQHLFVVQDSQGKDVGLVTMEDVLEELFGNIFDEKDMPKSAEPPSITF